MKSYVGIHTKNTENTTSVICFYYCHFDFKNSQKTLYSLYSLYQCSYLIGIIMLRSVNALSEVFSIQKLQFTGEINGQL